MYQYLFKFLKDRSKYNNVYRFLLSLLDIIEKMAKQTERENEKVFKSLCKFIKKDDDESNTILMAILCLLFEDNAYGHFSYQNPFDIAVDCEYEGSSSLIIIKIKSNEYKKEYMLFKSLLHKVFEKTKKAKEMKNWFKTEIFVLEDETYSYEYDETLNKDGDPDYQYDTEDIVNSHSYHDFSWQIEGNNILSSSTYSDSWGNGDAEFPTACIVFDK